MLVHTCCAPCLTFPFLELSSKASEIFIYFYNPNIQPYAEYKLRRDCLEQYCQRQGIELIEGSYDFERFFQYITLSESLRCSVCYELRLSEAAKYARNANFDRFTTTLLVSPYQEHQIIRNVGEAIGKKYGIEFYYRDFRNGWKQTISISRELSLYRQKYCGCLYSERERFYKPLKDQHQNFPKSISNK